MGISGDEAFLAARWTARLSTLPFLASYSATSLYALWPGRRTHWLARHRRGFGLSFAAAHFIHLAALIAYFSIRQETPVPFQLVVGGVGYMFLILMTVTSFAPGRRQLSPGAWRVLHRVGTHYLAVTFTLTYAHGALHEGNSWGIMALGCFAAVWAMRLARMKKRAGSELPA